MAAPRWWAAPRWYDRLYFNFAYWRAGIISTRSAVMYFLRLRWIWLRGARAGRAP